MACFDGDAGTGVLSRLVEKVFEVVAVARAGHERITGDRRTVLAKPLQKVGLVRGDRAQRQPVTFGIASADFFEVTDGLMPGDEVVISDMRDYLRLERVRLE